MAGLLNFTNPITGQTSMSQPGNYFGNGPYNTDQGSEGTGRGWNIFNQTLNSLGNTTASILGALRGTTHQTVENQAPGNQPPQTQTDNTWLIYAGVGLIVVIGIFLIIKKN